MGKHVPSTLTVWRSHSVRKRIIKYHKMLFLPPWWQIWLDNLSTKVERMKVRNVIQFRGHVSPCPYDSYNSPYRGYCIIYWRCICWLGRMSSIVDMLHLFRHCLLANPNKLSRIRNLTLKSARIKIIFLYGMKPSLLFIVRAAVSRNWSTAPITCWNNPWTTMA